MASYCYFLLVIDYKYSSVSLEHEYLLIQYNIAEFKILNMKQQQQQPSYQ